MIWLVTYRFGGEPIIDRWGAVGVDRRVVLSES